MEQLNIIQEAVTLTPGQGY